MLGIGLSILLFVFFVVMTCRVFPGVRRQAVVLAEFRQGQSPAYLSLLFPLGPPILVLGSYYLSVLIAGLAVLAALACYVPCMIIARRQVRALDKAGTDRVQKAQGALNLAFGTALAGVIYVAANLVMALAYSF